MNRTLAQLFPLDPDLVYLNHASFGAPTLAGLDHAEGIRRRIEQDTATAFDSDRVPSLRAVADHIAPLIGAGPGTVALVLNTTEGSGAVTAWAPLGPTDRVALLDVEYESVIAGWRTRCERDRIAFDLIPTPLPATTDAIIAALDAHPTPTWLVISAVTSGTALVMPLDRIAAWARNRDVRLVVDAAHVVGHVELDVSALGCAAAFGSLHKWLPVPRSVGFLWLDEELRPLVRQAAASVYWDMDDVVGRFSWRGTWDPAATLTLGHAVEEWSTWVESGYVADAEKLAHTVSDRLVAGGAVPTGEAELLPPRLRAVLLPGVGHDELRAALAAAGVRAWVGTSMDGHTVLRFATNIYNDMDDADRLLRALAGTDGRGFTFGTA